MKYNSNLILDIKIRIDNKQSIFLEIKKVWLKN